MRWDTVTRPCSALITIAVFLWVASGETSRAADADGAPCSTILLVTDTHLCALDGYDARLAQKRGHFGHGREPFRQWLNTVPGRVGADAIVVTGDMIDFFEGETVDGTLRADQIEHLMASVPLLNVPLWMTLGNHDIQTHAVSPDAAAASGGRAATNPHAPQARAAWIRQGHCFQQGTCYARNVEVGATHWKLCFLDNAYQVMNDRMREIHWDTPQLDWLTHELRAAPEHNVILFFHIPLTPPPWLTDGDTPQGIWKILDDHPRVVAAFCGHGHKNIVFDAIRLPAGHAIVQVETAAFGYDRNAWRTITLGEDAVTVSQPGSTQTEVIIKAAARETVPAAK